MTTKVEWQDRYDAPSAVVLRMFADRDFHEAKLAQMGLVSYEVLSHESSEDGFAIRIARAVPVKLPGVGSGGATHVVHSERWKLPEGSAEIRAEPRGMPLDMHGSAQLVDEGEGCVAHYRWQVKASLPVVGRTLEKFVASDMVRRAAEEADIARGLLDRFR